MFFRVVKTEWQGKAMEPERVAELSLRYGVCELQSSIVHEERIPGNGLVPLRDRVYDVLYIIYFKSRSNYRERSLYGD